MSEPRNLRSRLAAADSRKLARWLGDRARGGARRAAWHASRWRMQARDALGLAGRLPPGSLRASALTDATSDDRFYLKQLERHGPIFKLFWGSGELKICVVGFPRGRRLLNEHRAVLMHPAARDITPLVPANYLRSMAPEIHPHYRRLLKGALPDALVAAAEPELRAILRDELLGLAEGAGPRKPGERLFDALDRISLAVLLRLIFGVRPEASAARGFEDAFHRLGPEGWLAAVGPEQVAAFGAIRSALLQLVTSLRRGDAVELGDAMLPRLVSERLEAVDDTVIGNLVYVVERGRHDLRDLLRWVVKHLSDDPSAVADLHAALAAGPGGSQLARACVLETLRLDQAESVNREALEDFAFEGYRFPAGSAVSILTRETHRDPGVFPEPDRFRPARFLERSYSSDEYAPFGIGDHQCIAASLVVAVATLFVEELAGSFTWSVIDDGPRRYQAGRYHWEPSSRFAIALVPKP
ncbi:MAG TPA: cytochrome P450 [Myxococcota bacterium]|nr:cytochrome P450 [Myxococcota bacterium]